MTEMVFWLVILAALLVGNVLGLRLLPSIFRLKPLSWIQSCAAVGLLAVLTGGLAAGGIWLGPRLPIPWYMTTAAVLLLLVAGGLLALRVALWVDWTGALRASVAMVLVSAIVTGFAAMPILVFHRAYQVPTNAMAPTIKGRHFVGECPHCGKSTVVGFHERGKSMVVGFQELFAGERQPREEGICSACLQVGPATNVIEQVQMGDRIIARKLAAPRRWDLVVFRYPEDRNTIYVKRLVGLPGESIEVKDGGIWIDGARLQPPPEIAGLKWYLPLDGFGAEYAVEGQPAQLSDDEYFMLGDFSPSSHDSRFWGPVPEEDLLGVVSVIYFPPRSWKVLPQH